MNKIQPGKMVYPPSPQDFRAAEDWTEVPRQEWAGVVHEGSLVCALRDCNNIVVNVGSLDRWEVGCTDMASADK